MLVPALATTAAVVVLVTATQAPVPALDPVLATVTLLATAARTQLAFTQLQRLGELRRQAGTDELTGLPQPQGVHRPRHDRAQRVPRLHGRCCCWTWTGSRRSTTAWATGWVTSC